ncbi:hypothetical protein LSCM1_08271 [Leishmania martiniquensis]|uniref:Uncharacterized protein n=1 Tax=Leishmania martiniquensis TaxID=1580590 RepID=A0A836KUX6_9TRYP|nr:hypothetical protein LSCM1_08271 [Leishmania martiniquensis]
MKSRTSGSSRRAATGDADGRSLEAALATSSLLLWLPYSLAAVYVAYCRAFVAESPPAGGFSALSSAGIRSVSSSSAFSGGAGVATSSASAGVSVASSAAAAYGGSVAGGAMARPRHSFLYYYIFPAGFDIAVFLPLLLRVLTFSAAAILVTYYLAVHKHNGGEYLMAVAWALGTFSGYGWLYSSAGSVLPTSSSPSSSSASAGAQVLPSAARPSWLWLVVSLLTGLFSGILCKVKDIVDGKHARNPHLFVLLDRYDEVVEDAGLRRPASVGEDYCDDSDPGSPSTPATASASSPSSGVPRCRRIRMSTSHHLVSLGDRLYMVVPFCTGQWFSFIVHHGWRGIILENGTILLSLGLVGYTMLSYKFLKRQVLRVSGRVSLSATARRLSRHDKLRLREQQQQGDAAAASSGDAAGDPAGAELLEDVGEVAVIDVIDLISKLFTTSFGVVVLVVLGLNLFMTSLCIPFLKALFQLNALVSGVGIVIELIMYEAA